MNTPSQTVADSSPERSQNTKRGRMSQDELARSKRGEKRHRLFMVAGRIMIVAFLLTIWQLMYHYQLVSHVFLGSPGGVATYLYQNLVISADLWNDFGVTIYATVIAFFVGSALGVAVGFLFVVVKTLESLIGPGLAALNALPRIALAPVFILWFGIGTMPTILLGVSLTFFAVLTSTQAGARSVDPDVLTLCETLGTTRSQRFWRVILPGSIPILFGGFQLGMLYALLGVVAGELVGSPSGLGQKVSYLAATFQSDGVYGVLLILAVVGALLIALMSRLEKWLLRWR